MKVYIRLDEDNSVVECNTSKMEGFIETEIDNDLWDSFKILGCKYIDGELIFDDQLYESKNKQWEKLCIRIMREKECFSVLDRPFWLRQLTDDNLEELDKGYKAWLDAPETGVIPDRPNWIK